jgi:hypothetical protein
MNDDGKVAAIGGEKDIFLIGRGGSNPIDPTRPWIAFGGLTGRCTCSVARDMSGR